MNDFLQSRALVLNASLTPGKSVILDEHRGRLDVYPGFCGNAGRMRAQALLTGCLIEWSGQEKYGNTYMISGELVAWPAPWVRDDIAFVHHVCELCYVHLPPFQGAHEVYVLLSLLYEDCISGVTPETLCLLKKIFLYNLLSLLGLYPNDAGPVFDSFLFPLISSVGNSMFDLQGIRCNGHIEEKLTVWLCKALCQAHTRNPLKTVSFIKHLGVAL